MYSVHMHAHVKIARSSESGNHTIQNPKTAGHLPMPGAGVRAARYAPHAAYARELGMADGPFECDSPMPTNIIVRM